MNLYLRLLCGVICGPISVAAAAQSYYIDPPNPTSADQIRLITDSTTCFTRFKPLGVNPFSISMKSGHITVTFNRAPEYDGTVVPTLPPPEQEFRRRFVDLGKLPAGQYTWSVEDENPFTSCQESNKNGTVPKNQSLTVTDARKLKPAPFALHDVTGHWWNSNDPGVGLFFWQDEKDNTLGAWFTYDKNGSPKWYVFEPKWNTLDSSAVVDLYEASRAPGNVLPAVGKTDLKAVGKARIVLEGDSLVDIPSVIQPNSKPKTQKFLFIFRFSNEIEKVIDMQRYPGISLR